MANYTPWVESSLWPVVVKTTYLKRKRKESKRRAVGREDGEGLREEVVSVGGLERELHHRVGSTLSLSLAKFRELLAANARGL